MSFIESEDQKRVDGLETNRDIAQKAVDSALAHAHNRDVKRFFEHCFPHDHRRAHRYAHDLYKTEHLNMFGDNAPELQFLLLSPNIKRWFGQHQVYQNDVTHEACKAYLVAQLQIEGLEGDALNGAIKQYHLEPTPNTHTLPTDTVDQMIEKEILEIVQRNEPATRTKAFESPGRIDPNAAGKIKG